MRELEYPFDPGEIIRRRKSLRKALLAQEAARTRKKIAVLGGSTTSITRTPCFPRRSCGPLPRT